MLSIATGQTNFSTDFFYWYKSCFDHKEFLENFKRRLLSYRKIPKISPGAYIFRRPFFFGGGGGGYIWMGLSTVGDLRFSLIVGGKPGRKFTVSAALFYFVFEGNFPSTSPRGLKFGGGDLKERFLQYRFGGLIFGVAYTWRGLFSEFYGSFRSKVASMQCPSMPNGPRN